MAEVYLAEDTRLKRKVALKFMSAEFTADTARLNRFRQEARAASSLNHPSILTVFDIGEVNSAFFIATEYVEGETLRRRLAERRMDLPDAIDVAIQVASALAAAHQAGIIHRDVKPENIMLRPDGYVKLLDFGIAKLTESRADTMEIKAGATLPVQTEPGLIMGSPRYMSPEQVRGQEVDARTDIFSLGVVLYEMVTGRPPFEGSTVSDSIVAVLHQELPALSQDCPIAPIELQQAVNKSLKKDRSQRYQAMVDLLGDLRRIRRQLDINSDSAATLPNVSPISDSPTVVNRAAPVPTRDGVSSGSTPIVTRDAYATPATHPGQAVTSTKTAVSTRKKLAAGAAILLVALAGSVLYWITRNKVKRVVSFQEMKMSRITQSGNVTRAAISPDGKYAIYVTSADGQESLSVRQLATDSTILIAQPAHIKHAGLTFSADGNFVYYTGFTPGNLNGYPTLFGALYQIPTLGGAPKKIIDDIDSPVAISPDGKKLAFVRHNSQEGSTAPQEDAVIIADADGANPHKLFTTLWPERLASGGPAWVPDGSAVVCPTYHTGQKYFSIMQAGAADGVRKTLPCSTKWTWIGRVDWLPDGSGILMIATEEGGSHSQIWNVSVPEGAARRITNDLSDYTDLSTTSDAADLVAVQTQQLSNIWVGAASGSESPKQITSGVNNYSTVAWTVDGKLLYSSNEPGIWVMAQDGTNKRRLTEITGAELAASPDGASLAFSTYRDGTQNIWIMGADGANPRQLTNEKGSSFAPNWTADSKALSYQFQKPDSLVPSLRRLSLSDLSSRLLVEDAPGSSVISPDGRSIAYIDDKMRIAVLAIDASQPVKRLIDLPAAKTFTVGSTCGAIDLLTWAPDGQSLWFKGTQAGVSNIWSQPVNGGPPKKLTTFGVEFVYGFDVSRDGKELACIRGTEVNDAVVIRSSR